MRERSSRVGFRGDSPQEVAKTLGQMTADRRGPNGTDRIDGDPSGSPPDTIV
jgi:hypothetical protein